MNHRIFVLLAWMLALPMLSSAQTPAVRAPAKPTAPPAVTAPAATPPAAPAAPAAAPAPRPAAPAAAEPQLIDVNSADEKTLDSLPGVGPARAKKIIAARPYTEKQQVLDKKAVPTDVFAAIQSRIALVNVNKTSAADMAKILPNVGPVRSQAIVDKRPYASTQDLVTKGVLTQGVLDGLKGLITTGP